MAGLTTDVVHFLAHNTLCLTKWHWCCTL